MMENKQISTYFHSLAIKSDGTVIAWGSNDYGQCVVPEGLDGMNRIIGIDGGHSHSIALKSDGTVVAWGSNNGGQCVVPIVKKYFFKA